MRPSAPSWPPLVRRTPTYSRGPGPGLPRNSLTARISRNYEQVFAVVTGGVLLAALGAVLCWASR